MPRTHVGFEEMSKYPFFEALFKRRSRRISMGLKSIPAGSNSFTSNAPPQPLSALEEAVLISAVGMTGITLPDRPFQSPTGENILGTPNINFPGRAAGSTDNAQGTHFFLISDTGAYLLKRVEPADPNEPITPDVLVARAEQSKVKILDKRPDFPREFPYYLDSNRFLSNLPGSTILFPIVDMTRQYINALMYLLTEPDGHRPLILDDRNFYWPAAGFKWMRNGFMNKKIKISLGYLYTMRTQIEAELLLQNLMLMLQAMGLGGWIHSSISPTYLLPALGFQYVTPHYRGLDFFRWGTFESLPRIQPIGLPPHIQCMCPPYYKSMADAVQTVWRRRLFSPNLSRGPRRALSERGSALQERRDRVRQRHLHIHLRAAPTLSRSLRCNLCARCLAAGAPPGFAVLRHSIQKRIYGDAARASAALARLV
jgi:hypothetical protein